MITFFFFKFFASHLQPYILFILCQEEMVKESPTFKKKKKAKGGGATWVSLPGEPNAAADYYS